MKTKSSLALFSLFVFLAGCTSLQERRRSYSMDGKLCLRATMKPPSAIFTAPLRGTPIMCMRLGAPEARCLELCRTIGVSHRQISTSPANLGTGACQQ